MRKAGDRALTATQQLVLAVWPRHTAKSIERSLACTRWQAERIAKTGYIPAALHDLAVRVLRSELRKKSELYARYERELGKIDNEEALLQDRASDNCALSENGAVAAGKIDRTAFPSIAGHAPVRGRK